MANAKTPMSIMTRKAKKMAMQEICSNLYDLSTTMRNLGGRPDPCDYKAVIAANMADTHLERWFKSELERINTQ